jgi:hypothetical protein
LTKRGNDTVSENIKLRLETKSINKTTQEIEIVSENIKIKPYRHKSDMGIVSKLVICPPDSLKQGQEIMVSLAISPHDSLN